MNSFEDLEVWKSARNFRNEITKTTSKFPAEEKNRLTNQIIRSSRSITANIAEGFGRFHHQEYTICRIARGSLHEALDHLIRAADCHYINNDELQNLKLKYEYCLKLLNGYISYLKKARQAQTTIT